MVSQGDQIAYIGDYGVNGNWPAHLHFQIISDMKNKKGDFPGVTSKKERRDYLRLCPNPNLILGIEKLGYD